MFAERVILKSFDTDQRCDFYVQVTPLLDYVSRKSHPINHLFFPLHQ